MAKTGANFPEKKFELLQIHAPFPLFNNNYYNLVNWNSSQVLDWRTFEICYIVKMELETFDFLFFEKWHTTAYIKKAGTPVIWIDSTSNYILYEKRVTLLIFSSWFWPHGQYCMKEGLSTLVWLSTKHWLFITLLCFIL